MEMARRDPGLIYWRSLYDGEAVAGIHRAAFRRENFLHFPLFWRLHLILHLHGFDHDHALPSFHFRSLGREDANNLPRHGRDEVLRTFACTSAAVTRTERAGVADFNIECGITDQQTQTGGRDLSLDLVRFAAQHNREHFRFGARNVRREFLPVERDDGLAFPLPDLDTMGGAVENDLVDHSVPRNASSRASFFQFETRPFATVPFFG